jgi:hypothetical protein
LGHGVRPVHRTPEDGCIFIQLDWLRRFLRMNFALLPIVRRSSLAAHAAPISKGWITHPHAQKNDASLAREAGKEIAMRFAESNEGDYRIYAGAVPGRRGSGFIATVVVNRIRGAVDKPRVAYRDDMLAGGHRWPSPEAARLFAAAKARDVIRTEQYRLAC